VANLFKQNLYRQNDYIIVVIGYDLPELIVDNFHQG